MAGASLAAELAASVRVLLLEAEDIPGYHATGRSAAFWAESYGGAGVRPLTIASGAFLRERGLLRPRGALYIARQEGEAALREIEAELPALFAPVGRERLEVSIPGLRSGWDKGLEEPGCMDIDVAGLHAFYLKRARRAGARLLTGARVLAAERRAGTWELITAAGPFRADILVNAAGAWADALARLAGVRPLAIQPYRRTMLQLRIGPPVPARLPLVIDALGRFYFKPEAGGRLWLSPHDETASDPCDCAPEDIDVAAAIDRLQTVVDWRVEGVERRWAGLRSFAPDRLPVYGFAEDSPGFFWFAGQGGFGIQTAPAAAKIGAALLCGVQPEAEIVAVDAGLYRPGRFAN
jgi:D-arginine dehydrogenase